MFIVSPRVDEALEFDHLHELGVGAVLGVFAFSSELEVLSVVDDLDPEALFALALVRRMEFHHNTRGEGHVVEMTIVGVEEEKHLGDSPVMS